MDIEFHEYEPDLDLVHAMNTDPRCIHCGQPKPAYVHRYNDPEEYYSHKVLVAEDEMLVLLHWAGEHGRPLKLLSGTLTVLVDNWTDLWVLDVLKDIRRG